jgi:tetratricopeptide (TPR) repeat protein
LRQHRKALELDPHSLVALNALAWLLATCPEASLRNGEEAAQLSLKATRLSGGKYPQILDTMAAAYAESGQFEKAVETAKEALRLLVVQSDPSLARGLQARLKLYETRTAYHEE